MNAVPEAEAALNDSKLINSSTDSETEITLGILNAVHENSGATQRSMAKDLGVALGLANAYLKRCVKKGLVKVSQAPANRYAYYLTPKGFAEKSELTARYLTMSFNFFRHARTQCEDVFDVCAAREWGRVALVGMGDLAEIAILCAREYPVEFAGFFEQDSDVEAFSELPVFTRLEDLGKIDAFVIVDLTASQEKFDRLKTMVPQERILAPRLLNISRTSIGGAPE